MKRELFQTQLKHIEEELKLLGDMTKNAIFSSTEAIKLNNLDKAALVEKDDLFINAKKTSIEEACIFLIAREQPVASDLREIIAILNIIIDIERIGDFAKSNSYMVLLNQGPINKEYIDVISWMSETTSQALDESINAFLQRDLSNVDEISTKALSIASFFDDFLNELSLSMKTDPNFVDMGVRLIRISYNFKRIAEHIVNICERIEYLVTGIMHEIK